MADCELLPRCPFFNDYMADLPAMSEALKLTYCRGNNKRCARFLVYEVMGAAGVPADLLPTEEGRGSELVAQARWGSR
jgi:hypothetical protein